MTKKVLKFLKWFLISLLIALLIIYFRPAWTPSIASENGKVPICRLEKIKLGNLDQEVLIRSRDRNNPILLFIHGGPGMPMMYLAHSFQRPLEEKFTVVQWDERGAGKSYSPDIPTSTINVEQYLADALQLIDTLRYRYRQRKIFLVGHSWGTYLSAILVQRHPELFYSYISVGQVVDPEASAKIVRSFLDSAARVNGDTSLLRELGDTSIKSFESSVFKYGGELKHSTGYLPLVISGLEAPEYTFRDVLNVAKGPRFCGKYMKYNAINGTVMSEIRDFRVPVFFLTGSHDYTTPFPLIKKYFDTISAPEKQLIWFRESGHFPFYEEPMKFDSVMINIVLKGKDRDLV